VAVEPADDPLQRVLKARLYRGVLEFQIFAAAMWAGGLSGADSATWRRHRDYLLEMAETAKELWAARPAELTPWLEELVVAAKQHERLSLQRVKNGTSPPQDALASQSGRLKIEAELWKATHPK
jgi:hypothetical protein